MEETLKAIIQAAQSAGPFATMIMATLWWLERKERLELQRERNGLLERVLVTMSGITQAVKDIRMLFQGGRARATDD